MLQIDAALLCRHVTISCIVMRSNTPGCLLPRRVIAWAVLKPEAGPYSPGFHAALMTCQHTVVYLKTNGLLMNDDELLIIFHSPLLYSSEVFPCGTMRERYLDLRQS